MKKILIIAVLFLLSFKQHVPAAVEISFDGQTAAIVRTYFPAGSTYDLSGVEWLHNGNQWATHSFVPVSNSIIGIQIINAAYKNNGNQLSYSYVLIAQ